MTAHVESTMAAPWRMGWIGSGAEKYMDQLEGNYNGEGISVSVWYGLN